VAPPSPVEHADDIALVTKYTFDQVPLPVDVSVDEILAIGQSPSAEQSSGMSESYPSTAPSLPEERFHSLFAHGEYANSMVLDSKRLYEILGSFQTSSEMDSLVSELCWFVASKLPPAQLLLAQQRSVDGCFPNPELFIHDGRNFKQYFHRQEEPESRNGRTRFVLSTAQISGDRQRSAHFYLQDAISTIRMWTLNN
jgi:hypothetical protein